MDRTIDQLPAVEEWRDVIGYEGIYEVSSLGRVKSLPRTIKLRNHPTLDKRTIRGRILVPKLNRPSGGNYARFMVVLCRNGEEATKNVARIVAQAFIPNPNGLSFVLHLDDNATNNVVENLQWGTHQDNVRHAVDRHRYRYGQDHHGSVLSDGQRDQIRKFLVDGITVGEIARMFNVDHRVISDVNCGKTYGFSPIWPRPRGRARAASKG